MADLNLTQPALPPAPPTPDGPDKKESDETKKLNRDIEKHFSGQVEKSERVIKDNVHQWKRNVEMRQGQPNGAISSPIADEDDDYQSDYNPDWFLTKTKTASLFSQVPRVILTHRNQAFRPAVGPFAKEINYELGARRCNVGAAMFECMSDVVNASGIAAIEVGYAARFEDKEVPTQEARMLPPDMQTALQAAGQLPMETVPVATDYRFFTDRISPADLLTPGGFTGSDFDKGPFIGRRFLTSWAEASVEFKLDDEDKESLVSEGDIAPSDETLRVGKDSDSAPSEMKAIKGKRLYYWRSRVDPHCKSFDEIWEIVWLESREKPVKHEKWTGQKFDDKSKKFIGSLRFPIRVCTTTYISDNPIPPSDSQAGRPQVNDLRRSRNQMFQNRAYSIPFRWFNTDKTDPSMHDLLMRGQVQGMLPVQGDGSKVFGEIARASYPAEDLTFDKVAQADLFQQWLLGPNQTGTLAAHETTKGEADLAQGGFNSTVGLERQRVVEFFLSAVEVLAGLMALYSDFQSLSPEERQVMTRSWDGKRILHDLAFEILPDSQIVMDAATQIKRKFQLMNMTAKSGFANVKLLVSDLFELHGEDPNVYVVDPQPHPMKPMTVSLSVRGKEDLMNPIVIALMNRNQQLPTPEEMETARDILRALQVEAPMSVVSQQAMMRKQQQQQAQQRPPMPGQRPPGPPALGPRAVPPPGQDMMPQFSLANKVAKRSREI